MRRAREPLHLAQELDFLRHLSLKALQDRSGRRQRVRYQWMQEVRDVVYRCELAIQNEGMAAA